MVKDKSTMSDEWLPYAMNTPTCATNTITTTTDIERTAIRTGITKSNKFQHIIQTQFIY